ncbi:MAG: caspase family protein [Pseudomonadota bacterium]
MSLRQKLLTSLLSVVFISPSLAHDRALLVGIDTYQYVTPLRGSKNDVKDMRRFIQKVWGYRSSEIRTLLDKEATRENILNSFDEWLIEGSQRGDRVFFYYSGHGYYIYDEDGDEDDGYDETLCPVETQITANTMILDDEIKERLQRLKGRQVTVVIDACHSGSVTKNLAQRSAMPIIKIPVLKSQRVFGSPKSLSRSMNAEGFISSERNVIAYSAVAPNQVALVDIEHPYRGVFTHRFIQGVEKKHADSNHDGQVSHAELLEYTRRESQAYCDRHKEQCTAGVLSPQLEAKPEILAADVRSGKAPRQAKPVLVDGSNNKANLQVKILPHYRFKAGEAMKIKLRSDHDGYFLLFDINSDNELTRIFPNKYSEREGKDGYVRAGKTVTIPAPEHNFQFTADEPFGKGLLVALVVEDKLPKIQKLLPEAFKQLGAIEAQAVLQELRQQLNQTLPQLNANQEVVNRPVRWSIAVKNYDIVRRGGVLKGLWGGNHAK